MVGGEEVVKIKGAVTMKNQTHIADYAKWATITQMIVGVSVENLRGEHITCEIAEIDNETRLTLSKDVTVFYSCLNTQQESQDLWYIDCGCLNNMIGDKNSFIRVDEVVKLNITLSDGRTQEIAGKRTIAVKAKNDFTKYIQDVLYVPDVAQNLLGVGQSIQKGYIVTFDNDKCIIVDEDKKQLIASIVMTKSRLIPFRMSKEQKVALSSVMDNMTLWHHKYDHLNLKSLKVLKQRNMVIGLPTINADKNICEGYIT